MVVAVDVRGAARRASEFRQRRQDVRHRDDAIVVDVLRAATGLAASVVVKRVRVVVASFGVGASEHAIAFDVGVEPRQAAVDPIPEELHLLLVGVADEGVGPHVGAQPRPAFVVSDARLGEQGHQRIDGRVDALVAPWPRPVIFPHASGQPTVRRVFQQTLKPKRVLVPATGVCFKSRGVDGIAVVCVSKGEVVIPPRPHHNLAPVGVLLFVEVRAEAVAVDVLGHLVGEVKVHEGMRVDVRRVPQQGVHEVVPGQGVLEGCEVVLDVRQLVGMQVVRFRLVQLDVHLSAS